jgi:lipoyl(octanoyl) transferase
LEGAQEQIILIEHPPVITFGRRAGVERHLIASDEQLARLGVEVVQSDRGGDITFHGPGQVVAYPIIRLMDHRLSVGGYVRRLEEAVVATLAGYGVAARAREEGAVGIWATDGGGRAAKVCAIGVRIRRGVSMHGLALNLGTDLRFFELIVPCGLPGRPVTSIERLLGPAAPDIATVKKDLSAQLIAAVGL